MELIGLAPGDTTSLGSMPGSDFDASVAAVMARTPRLPAAPSLPAANPAEYMLAASAAGMRGVEICADGSLEVDPCKIDAFDPVVEPLPPVAHESFTAFLDQVADREEPIKFQLGGPITLGAALWRSGVDSAQAFAAASAAVRLRGAAMIAEAKRRAPLAPLFVFVDEPGLVSAVEPGFPLNPDETIDAVSGVLAVLEPHAVTGLHCCGPTDWRLAQEAGPQVLSMPVHHRVVSHAGTIATHLDRGGWIAWGAVPTDGPISNRVERHWTSLGELWCGLVAAGCDPHLIRERAIITPACGLAHHTPSQADEVLRLTAELGRRVQMQQFGLRLTIGA